MGEMAMVEIGKKVKVKSTGRQGVVEAIDIQLEKALVKFPAGTFHGQPVFACISHAIWNLEVVPEGEGNAQMAL